MVTSVKIERYEEYSELVRVVSRSEKTPATDKDIIRPLHYDMLVGTYLPEPDWHRLGALVVFLFRNSGVIDVEIWLTDNGLWIADALVEFGDRQRLRRGEGKTPVQAMIELVTNIQRY